MKAYFATARLCVLEKSYFGLANVIGQYLLKAAGVGALLLIWRSLAAQGADLGGFTLEQFYSYTLLSAMLAPLLDIHTPATGWLHDGTMLSLYLRPSSLFSQLSAYTVAGWVIPLLTLSLPLGVTASLCGVNLTPQSPWFFPSLLMTISLGFAVDFLFACLMIRLRNLEWPVRCLRDSLTAIFSGSLIPFAALPWNIGRVLELSPLGALAGAPLAICTGLGDARELVVAQLVWNAVLWPLTLLCLRHSRERMVSFGG
ncbi:MAG: ABC-2 family transporter protein [Eubacteriales bacterium]|nr:ABC-2 family transporter protein [Eubacteriales bacterium]